MTDLNQPDINKIGLIFVFSSDPNIKQISQLALRLVDLDGINPIILKTILYTIIGGIEK